VRLDGIKLTGLKSLRASQIQKYEVEALLKNESKQKGKSVRCAYVDGLKMLAIIPNSKLGGRGIAEGGGGGVCVSNPRRCVLESSNTGELR
jgi:hypothetical protein